VRRGVKELKAEQEITPFAPMTRPAASQPFRLREATEKRATDMNKVARLLVMLAIVLVTISGCGDLYCGVPKGDNVNVLGQQRNG